MLEQVKGTISTTLAKVGAASLNGTKNRCWVHVVNQGATLNSFSVRLGVAESLSAEVLVNDADFASPGIASAIKCVSGTPPHQLASGGKTQFLIEADGAAFLEFYAKATGSTSVTITVRQADR